MYGIVVSIELASVLMLLVLSLIAGSKASKLVFHGSNDRLRIRSRKLLWWAVYVSVAACAVVGCVAILAVRMGPIFWIDRVALHIPLVGVPVLFVWFSSVPKLINLYKDTKKEADGPVDGTLRSRASHASLVAPFQLLALGALTTFYFVLVPPIPFEWLDAAIPVSLFALLSVALWTMHRRRSERAGRSDAALKLRSWPIRALRNVGVLVIAAAVAAPFFVSAMNASRLPAELDMGTGVADYGGGAAPAGGGQHDHTAHAAGKPASTSASTVSVTQLTGPRTGKPDRQYTLTAEKKTVRLSSGKEVDAWTYNGQIPGPELRMKEGELVEVTLINKDIDDGVTIHWHGLDVPNAEDGVAGATQNAVMPGETYTYRFLAEQVGTFWYHSHQHSKEAVQKGLFGALVVEPRQPQAKDLKDITVITHVWRGAGFAIGSSDTVERMSIAAGTPVRIRLINTDDWVRQTYTLIGTEFQVAAIDGTDLNKPGTLQNTRLELLTGGRYDVTFTMPDGPVFLSVGEGKKLGLFMSPDGSGDIPSSPPTVPFEPEHYGSPAPTPFDADSRFDREFTMILDNKLGFYNGVFSSYDTINGAVFPNTPMFVVKEGDLVKTTIVNRGSVDHPMHLHGHHMLVLSRNEERVSGSPWWSDTLDVAPGETYEVAFRADNPGIWMDHCHNLQHAAAGMTMHLMYEGVTTPFMIGSATSNHPE